MKKDEFLIQIKKILNLFDELEKEIGIADEMCNKLPELKSDVDKLLSDYYHIIEDEELDSKGYEKIGELIHKERKKRRDIIWLDALTKVYLNHKNQLLISPKSNRSMFSNTIQKTLSGLDTSYNYRILSEEDVKDIVNFKEEPKRKTKYDIDKIQQMLNDGYTMVKIAEEFGTNQPNISRLCKKYGLKKAKK